MESAKEPENNSTVTEKNLHLPTPKVFFSKSKSQVSAALPAVDSQPQMSVSSTQILKSDDESVKLSVGSHVIVGGVKEGILRFSGRVHFMEGDWCGVELNEPEGLHDGTVEQVRYFTCKSGHGIFAPQAKVALMHDCNLSNQKNIFRQEVQSGGDGESQLKCKFSGSLENISSDLVDTEPVQIREKSVKPSKLARPRSAVSFIDNIDLKEASNQSKLPRPKSAVVSLAQEDSNPDFDVQVRRSSLMDFASLAKQQRASPKRVTFDDTLEYDLLSSPRISATKLRKSDLQGEGYASDEGSYDSMTPRAHFDPYMALTLTYDLESSPPRRKTKAIVRPEGIRKPVEKIKTTTLTETEQLDSIQSAPEVNRLKKVGDSNQGSTEQLLHDIFDRMDEEISNIPTPDTAEIQMIIPDSLSSSDEDARRMFSCDGRSLTVLHSQKKQVQLDSDRRLIKYSVAENDERSGEIRGGKGMIDSLEGNHSEEFGLKMGAISVMSGNMGGGELQALKKKASFELARTALAQYADLIRAAQEDRTHRLAKASVKPKPQSSSACDPCIEEPCPAEQLLEESTEGDFFDPDWSKTRTDQVKPFEDVELSDSVDSLNVDVYESLSSIHRDGLDEYETFEGEDLRTISADDVIVIDSDEEFIEGERLAISGELGLDDSLIIDSRPLVSKAFQHPEAVSEGHQDVDGNHDDPASALVRPEITGQISVEDWNNTINNMRQYDSDASTLLPLVSLRRRQQSRPVSMVSTASSDAGIVDDMLPCYGPKNERPISLISSTSSTDTGCAMEVDSDMLSSTMMSSTLDDLVESWQEPGSADATANWLTSYAEPDLQGKTKEDELLDYPVTVIPGDNPECCVTDMDAGVTKCEHGQKELKAAEPCGKSFLVGTGKGVVRAKLLEVETDVTVKPEGNSYNEKLDSVLLKLESGTVQNNSSTDVHLDLSSSSSFASCQDDQLVLPVKGLSCAEFPPKLASGVSVQVENSSKGMSGVAPIQPATGFSSEIQYNLCSGLEPVLAKVLAISSEIPEASLVHDRDLQVYMVNEEPGFAEPGKLISSEDACLADKGSSLDGTSEVCLEDKGANVMETEPMHQSTSANEPRLEEKCDERKPKLENMNASVTENYGNDSLNVCQTNLVVETTVNSEQPKVDETYSSRSEREVNELVASSENVQFRENGLNKDKTFPDHAANTTSDEKNGQDEVQGGQKMNNTGSASVSRGKDETFAGRGNDISCLEKESKLLCEGIIEEGFQRNIVEQELLHLTDSLQESDNDGQVDIMKEDAGNVARRKEEADDDLCKEEKAGAAEGSKATSEVVDATVISGLLQISDEVQRATEGREMESGKRKCTKSSEGQKALTAPSEIAESHETVMGSSEISEIVLGLAEEGSEAMSESTEDSNTFLRLVKSSDIMSETRGREEADNRLLGQDNDDVRGSVSRNVMLQAKTVIQNRETRSSSDIGRRDSHENRKQVAQSFSKNVILKPDKSDKRNEIARTSTKSAEDATRDSEVTQNVTLNQQKKRVHEKDVTDGGNVSKGMRNGQTKAPSKLMVRGSVRGAVSETLGQVDRRQGKADGNKDSKDDSLAGNGKARQKTLNVGKSSKTESDSIKPKTISGNIKVNKTSDDVSKSIKGDSGAENGNTRRTLPNSSRNVKSEPANTKNVNDGTKIRRSQSNVDRLTRNDRDSTAASASPRQAAGKDQKKIPRPELPTDLKGNGRKKSYSVSEPLEGSAGKDLEASASESSESDSTIRDNKGGNLVKLSVVQNTSTANISRPTDGIKSKEDIQSGPPSNGKGKDLSEDVTREAKSHKPPVVKTLGLNTAAPAKKSGVSPTTRVPLSSRSVGRKSLSSQENLVDAKAGSTQENAKMGIGRKNPSYNPVSALAVPKRGSSMPGREGKGRLPNNTKAEEKTSVAMMSKKEPNKTDQPNPRASSLQSTRAVTQSGKPNVITQASASLSSVYKKGIPIPGSARGHNDGDRTITRKQTKESASKKPSTVATKDAKSTVDSSSQIALQIDELKLQLKQTQQQLDGVVKERGELQLEVAQAKEEQASEIRKIRQKHQQEIDSLKKAFVDQTKTEIEKVIDQHSHEVKTLKSYHDRHLSEAKQEHRVALGAREKEFEDAIAKLKAEHLQELNETKASHDQQLNEISERFEEIKISLSCKVEQLRSKCDELCSRELCYKDTCKRETDLREQAALEVDSLRVVLEQRNGEIRKLRQQNAHLDEKVQEIPVLKERITKLQQSIENLEAVNDLKSGHEKQLADMHQGLLRKFERESKAMKRLSMENEELMWRLSQSDFGPSCLQEKFPSASGGVALMSKSYDSQQAATMTRRTRSNTGANQEATMSRSYDGFSDFYTSTPKAVSSREADLQSAHSLSSSSSASGSSHLQRVKLRRSGTYEVMDQENVKRKP